MESQGIRQAFNSSVDLIAPMYATETAVNKAFQEKVAEVGLSGALKWRAAQFE